MGLFRSGGAVSKTSDSENTFGENGRIGAAGETFYAEALDRSGISERYEVYRTLSIPVSPRDGKQFDGDVDIAVANGNNLALVDVKKWSAQAPYWTMPLTGKPMFGLSSYYNQHGEWQLSLNMQMAVERYSERLPGVNILPMVVFVPTKNTGRPANARFLVWPGGIQSYRSGESFSRLYSFLGEPRGVQAPITKLLLEMKR